MKADANIEFRNEASGDQFRAILWRTEQKTTQKAEGGEKTTHKNESKEKILEILRINPEVTTSDLIEITELSRSGVEKIIRQLKESGRIRRVGPDKGGHWEVCE